MVRALKRWASFCARSSVRLATVMRAGPCGEMGRAELDHLPRADEEHVLVLQTRKDARREAHRSGGH